MDETNAALVVVLPEPAERIAPLARREGWTGPVLGDPDRSTYLAYGLGRLPWHRVITVKTLLLYAGFLLRGRLPQPPGQDVRQQGGDFIVDGQGILRFAHAGRSTDDRPPVDILVRCLRSLAPPQTAATA
jgi:hypothetical protein